MDALKNAASSVAGNLGQKQSTTGATGAGTQATNPNHDWKDQGVDMAQSGGYLPKTGTQQGNIIDQGQKAYDSYEGKQKQ